MARHGILLRDRPSPMLPSVFWVAKRHEILVRLLAHLEDMDSELRQHGERVRSFAVAIAREMDLPEADLPCLEVAALLHDVGKLDVSRSILEKPARLNRTELHRIRAHPALGEKILREQGFSETACRAVRAHHENYGGKGYPDGLRGDRIPLFARILRVADAYDVMTAGRPYRGALPPEKAVCRLRSNAGRLFDPAVLACFLRLLSGAAESGLELGAPAAVAG